MSTKKDNKPDVIFKAIDSKYAAEADTMNAIGGAITYEMVEKAYKTATLTDPQTVSKEEIDGMQKYYFDNKYYITTGTGTFTGLESTGTNPKSYGITWGESDLNVLASKATITAASAKLKAPPKTFTMDELYAAEIADKANGVVKYAAEKKPKPPLGMSPKQVKEYAALTAELMAGKGHKQP